MKISGDMKDFLIGFPVALFIAVIVIWLIATLGGAAIILIVGLVILGCLGAVIGEFIRDKFGIWK